MLQSRLFLLLGAMLCLCLHAGCESKSSTAKPAADVNDIQQFLADNPEMDVNMEEETDNEEEN